MWGLIPGQLVASVCILHGMPFLTLGWILAGMRMWDVRVIGLQDELVQTF